jgi:hypothetical protein
VSGRVSGDKLGVSASGSRSLLDFLFASLMFLWFMFLDIMFGEVDR